MNVPPHRSSWTIQRSNLNYGQHKLFQCNYNHSLQRRYTKISYASINAFNLTFNCPLKNSKSCNQFGPPCFMSSSLSSFNDCRWVGLRSSRLSRDSCDNQNKIQNVYSSRFEQLEHYILDQQKVPVFTDEEKATENCLITVKKTVTNTPLKMAIVAIEILL